MALEDVQEENTMEQLKTLREKLQNDRFIKIYVGNETKPYLVPATLLTSLSDYFTNALKHEGWLGDEEGVLRFPEDNTSAWEMLLHWKVEVGLGKKRIMKDVSSPFFDLFVQCFVLADKYNIKQFQDYAMLELISATAGGIIPLETVKLVFDNTAPGSVLRTLVMEEVIHRMNQPEHKHEDLDALDGVLGFTSELMNTLDRYKKDPDSFDFSRKMADDLWLKFMEADGPIKHWVYRQ